MAGLVLTQAELLVIEDDILNLRWQTESLTNDMDKALLDLGAQDVEARTSSEERKLASFMLSSIMRVGEASERATVSPNHVFWKQECGCWGSRGNCFLKL